MRILFDTNVILDAVLERSPHDSNASELIGHVEDGRIIGLLGATTVTTIYYLGAKSVGSQKVREELGKLLNFFEVASVGRAVLTNALSLNFSDYEDAVIHETASYAGADGIVTRDRTGFRQATTRIYSPDELLGAVEAIGQG